MGVLGVVAMAAGCLIVAYVTYARWLSRRVFGLDASTPTPACQAEDDADFVPTKKSVLFGHHFTSIAGTGPIVGPAIAVMWGWLPAVLWVVLGAMFIGMLHDLGSLVVSLRNKGRTLGDIAGDLLGPRARVLFLSILIVGLWIVLAVFGLVIAAVLKQYPAAVTPVVAQVPLALLIGVLIHRRGRSIVVPSLVALAVMLGTVWLGSAAEEMHAAGGVAAVGYPGWLAPMLESVHWFNVTLAALPVWVWTAGLLLYAYAASVLPVWTLLQPRDYINALQLVLSLGLIVLGLVAAAVFGGPAIPDGLPVEGEGGAGMGVAERLPLEFVAPVLEMNPAGAPPLLPMLFITIACGACSGFHCLVASGTTSKQVRCETHARPVAAGSMLVEGFLAVLVIAACAAGLGLGNTAAFRDIFTEGRYVDESQTQVETVTEVSRAMLPSGEANPWVLDVRTGTSGLRSLTVYAPDIPSTHFDDGIDGFGGPIVARSEGEAATTVLTPRGSITFITNYDYLASGILAFDHQYTSWQAAGSLGRTVGAFVQGSGNFLAALGFPIALATALMAVMVAAFAATTMDTACRLQRYVIQELSALFLPKRKGTDCTQCGYDCASLVAPGSRCPECGAAFDPGVVNAPAIGVRRRAARWFNPFKWLATVHGATVFAVVSAFVLAMGPVPSAALPAGSSGWWAQVGADLALWFEQGGRGGLILWPLFGATNQLLAGLAFLVVIAWLRSKRKPAWFAVPPMVLMLVMPAWAMSWQAFVGNADNPSWWAQSNWLLVGVAIAALALEVWLVVEAALRWRGPASA